MKTLNYSNIIFDSREHIYLTPDGKQLHGITSLLNRQLYHGKKYDGVPLAILKAAAERGSKVHMEVEMYFAAGFVPAMEEAKAIIEKFDRKEIIATEYLVSDEENFATAIDLVDSDFNLYDIKTTAVLDENYTSWQLSICAYLFEIQNKFPAKDLFAIHVRGKEVNIVPLPKHSKKEVEELLACDLLEENYFQKLAEPVIKDLPLVQLNYIENIIEKIENEAKTYKEMREEMLEVIYKKMEEKDLKKIETNNMILTRVLPSESVTIDTKKLKEELPEIAEKYEKIIKKKGYVKITLKQ